MLAFWITLTNFGGAAVTVPAAAAVTVWLAIGRVWRMALIWALLFVGGALLVVTTKVLFLGWGIGIRALDFTGISGHAMQAAALFPTMAYLVLQDRSQRIRLGGVALALLFSAGVAASRVALAAHSVSEAVAGCVVGFAVSAAFIYLTRKLDTPKLRMLPVALSLFALVAFLHGESVPTQRWITDVALHLSGREQSFRRAQWKMDGAQRLDKHVVLKTMQILPDKKTPAPR
ncbi:phosphatase PAP2 family protein [Pandoraea terrae]